MAVERLQSLRCQSCFLIAPTSTYVVPKSLARVWKLLVHSLTHISSHLDSFVPTNLWQKECNQLTVARFLQSFQDWHLSFKIHLLLQFIYCTAFQQVAVHSALPAKNATVQWLCQRRDRNPFFTVLSFCDWPFTRNRKGQTKRIKVEVQLEFCK